MQIDNLGNILDIHGGLVGYYDASTGQCFDLNAQPLNCPPIPSNIMQPTVESKPTWFIAAAAAAAFWYWNKKRNG